MSKKIIITDMPITTAKDSAVRTVLSVYEDGECLSLNIADTKSIIGDIYLARVDNVVKNINSAFVAIDKNNTCYYSLTDNKTHYFFNPKNNVNVNQGDSLLVQITKDATKIKPATASSRIELSGYFVVLSLDMEGVGVSKKIKTCENVPSLKKELCALIENACGSGILAESHLNFGFIIRSNFAQLESIEPALNEARALVDKLQTIIRGAMYQKAPVKLSAANPAYMNLVDDMPLDELDSIITDNEEIFNDINARFQSIFDKQKPSLRLYDDKLLALYNLYDINKQIEKALSRKIWLKSGGYIIIDYTEACTVIDVNSGKYVTKSHDAKARENAFFLVNSQAAAEIARQLKLRNISGMIIVDFINMEDKAHVDKILAVLKEEFAKDKISTKVVDITKLGLVEITRKREGAMLHEYLNQKA